MVRKRFRLHPGAGSARVELRVVRERSIRLQIMASFKIK